MSPLTAQELIEIATLHGVEIKLNENFDLDVHPASRLWSGYFEILKAEKPKLVKHLARLAAKDLLLSTSGDLSLFNLYHDHHFKCTQCVAAGQGYGRRCPEGKAMWFQYQLEGYCEK